MSDLKERYGTATRAAKEAIRQRKDTPRSAEEQRVFDAFRKQARSAYSALKQKSLTNRNNRTGS